MLFVSFDPIEFRRRVLNQIETANQARFFVYVISTTARETIRKKYSFNYSAVNLRYLPDSSVIKYPVFNLILFFKILFKKIDAIHFRGLIPIPAILFRQWFNKSLLIYDAHEYYRGHEIFHHRPLRKAFWMWFEKKIINHLEAIITVCEPLADLLRQDYPGVKTVEVIRSLPSLKNKPKSEHINPASEGLVLFHGYFLPGRGLENTIKAFSSIQDKAIKLIMIGEGPLENRLQKLSNELGLTKKILFQPFIANEQLIEFISQADIGLTLIEPDCINRKYALPNKFFEYIHAGVPVLASNIPTLQQYIDRYAVGRTVDPGDAQAIAKALIEMANDRAKLKLWKKNCRLAANELNWEKESEKMKDIYRSLYTLPV